MSRDEIVEAMARGMYGKGWDGPRDKQPGEEMKEVWRRYCRPALTALETALGIDLAKIASGESVVMPWPPSPQMQAVAWRAWQERHGGRLGPGPAFTEALGAMIEEARKAGT